MPGFDLLDLTLFVAVLRAGSITRGAREVHLALPSASARIRAMETALGTGQVHAGDQGGVAAVAAGVGGRVDDGTTGEASFGVPLAQRVEDGQHPLAGSVGAGGGGGRPGVGCGRCAR